MNSESYFLMEFYDFGLSPYLIMKSKNLNKIIDYSKECKEWGKGREFFIIKTNKVIDAKIIINLKKAGKGFEWNGRIIKEWINSKESKKRF